MAIKWSERTAVKKDPGAKLVYELNWRALGWLATGASIVDHEVTIDGPDAVLTFDNDSIVDDDTVQFRLLAGTLGADYTVTIHIVTDETPVQEDDRSILVQIRAH
jgi:hypothetical protein